MNAEYKRIYPLVRKLEEEYGSVLKAPDDDEDYKKLAIASLPYNPDKLLKDIESGYTYAELRRRHKITGAEITGFCNKHHTEIKRRFKYLLENKHGQSIYTDSLGKLGEVAFNKSFPNMKRARQVCRDNGWSVYSVDTIWKDIPNGCYFFLSYMSAIKRKNGEDSYVFSKSRR